MNLLSKLNRFIWSDSPWAMPAFAVLACTGLGIPAYFLERWFGYPAVMLWFVLVPILFIGIVMEWDDRKERKALATANATRQPVILERGEYRHVFFPEGWYAPALWITNNGHHAIRWFRRNNQQYCVAKP